MGKLFVNAVDSSPIDNFPNVSVQVAKFTPVYARIATALPTPSNGDPHLKALSTCHVLFILLHTYDETPAFPRSVCGPPISSRFLP